MECGCWFSLGFCWNSPCRITLSLSSLYLHHENPLLHKSHHNIKANGQLFPDPSLTVTFFLPVGICFRLGYPGCWPQEPPPPSHCCWPGLDLAVGEEAPAVCLPGSEEEEGKCAPLFHPSSSGVPREAQMSSSISKPTPYGRE